MKSPSVLEYLLTLFRPSQRINLDEFFGENTNQDHKKIAQVNRKKAPQGVNKKNTQRAWLMAIGSALSAQLFLEPINRNEIIAIFLYDASIYFCWKGLGGKSKKEEYQTTINKWPKLKIKVNLFILSVIFLVWAYIKFGDGTFNRYNLFLWGAGILCFVFSILKKHDYSKKISITEKKYRLFLGLGFLVMILAFYFRFFRLDIIPLEMFSDHAEKLLDIQDVLDGHFPVFFERNTGREAIQFYLSAAIIKFFRTGINFFSLKLGMAIAGILTLPFIFLLGRQLGGKWVGIISMAMASVGYWPNVISRVGLRFALYPLFTAISLYFLIKGLQEKRRNDLVFAGLMIGVGLYGYSPFRIMPLLILLIFLFYTFDRDKHDPYSHIFSNMAIVAFSTLVISIPLLRYAFENPGIFSYRAITRLTGVEQAIADPLWIIFMNNLLRALTMFFNNNGVIWVHSIPNRPALDVVTAAFYFIGTIYLLIRFVRYRKWEDATILVSIPILMMPSILSLAFPGENPSLNRTGGAYPLVFIVGAIGFYQAAKAIISQCNLKVLKVAAITFFLLLMVISSYQNFDLVFNQYANQYAMNAWNTSEIGNVIAAYWNTGYSLNGTFVVPYPHWVDTRLVGICAGIPRKDFALWAEDFHTLELEQGPKLLFLNLEDVQSLDALKRLFPGNQISRYYSKTPGKDFLIFQTSN